MGGFFSGEIFPREQISGGGVFLGRYFQGGFP